MKESMAFLVAIAALVLLYGFCYFVVAVMWPMAMWIVNFLENGIRSIVDRATRRE